MSIIKETFYRCECGNPYFIDVSEIVIRRDPDRTYEDDYRSSPPMIESHVYKYKCSKCGKELKRGKTK